MTVADELLADPEQIFLVLVVERRASGEIARVHEQERLGEMLELEPAKEVRVGFGGSCERDFFSRQDREQAVARQRRSVRR